MAREEPRRFLIAVGVATYGSEEWDDLEHVPSELAGVINLLTGQFQLERVLEPESKCPDRAFLTALSAWVKGADRHPDDHVVFYWSGHGAVADGRLRLVLPDTTDVLANALALEDVVGVLLQEARIGPVLLLLDVCYAGQGALDIGGRLKDLTRDRPRQSPPSIVALWATGSRDEAEQLVFANAFVEAVQSTVDPDERLRPGLDIARIAERVAMRLKGCDQHPGFWWSGSASSFAFLPNPHHIAHWPEGIDLATQRLFARLDPAARGVVRAEETGWFFRGRQRVFTDLCAWLKGEPKPGLCRVTGDVGAGKSAVLSRLYLLSRADYRRQFELQTLKETEVPPIGAIDTAVLLSNKTIPEVIAEIARGLRVSAETRDQLIAALRQRERCPVLLVDGLDEAVAPRNTRDLLEALGQTAARVIVGSRRPALEAAAPAELHIDLDVAPWADHRAVERYLAQRLQDELDGSAAPSGSWQQDLDGTARAVAERAGGNFLIARLTATALMAGASGDPRSPDWKFPRRSVTDSILFLRRWAMTSSVFGICCCPFAMLRMAVCRAGNFGQLSLAASATTISPKPTSPGSSRRPAILSLKICKSIVRSTVRSTPPSVSIYVRASRRSRFSVSLLKCCIAASIRRCQRPPLTLLMHAERSRDICGLLERVANSPNSLASLPGLRDSRALTRSILHTTSVTSMKRMRLPTRGSTLRHWPRRYGVCSGGAGWSAKSRTCHRVRGRLPSGSARSLPRGHLRPR